MDQSHRDMITLKPIALLIIDSQMLVLLFVGRLRRQCGLCLRRFLELRSCALSAHSQLETLSPGAEARGAGVRLNKQTNKQHTDKL